MLKDDKDWSISGKEDLPMLDKQSRSLATRTELRCKDEGFGERDEILRSAYLVDTE